MILTQILFVYWAYIHPSLLVVLFFFNDPPPPEIYTLSLHDALPIYGAQAASLAAGYLAKLWGADQIADLDPEDRKSTRLNSSHLGISYAVFCLKKKKKVQYHTLCTVRNRVNTNYM